MTREPPPIEFRAAHEIGIGMTDKCLVPVVAPPSFEAILNSMYYIRGAFDAALVAWYTKKESFAVEVMWNLKIATDTLGFDLVPRLTAAECHEQAIARRVAEDDR